MREILRSAPAMGRLGVADRALASRLAMGTVACVGLLDDVLDERLRRPSSLEPRVRDALRIASYEVCYLSTPSRAAVSQGVELVRSVAPRAASMANAVLRRVLDEVRPLVERARARSATEGFAEDDLVWVSGLPRWIVRRVVASRGLAAARDLCQAQLEPAPVYVAANLLLHDAGQAERLLAERGLGPRRTRYEGTFALESPAGLAGSGLVDEACVVVSDLAAQAVARIAVATSPRRILEVGQGRGTKTLLLASASLEKAESPEFVGVENVPFKVDLSRRRLREAGLDGRFLCLEMDGRRLAGEGLPLALDRGFDVVLLDAPCSGTGTMRRHPEIAWGLARDDLDGASGLPALQAELLEAAASQVRSGGTLTYATCSVLAEEDEAVVEAFLASPAGRGFESVAQAWGAGVQCPADGVMTALPGQAGGRFLSIPRIGGPDGHFCAMLRRSAS